MFKYAIHIRSVCRIFYSITYQYLIKNPLIFPPYFVSQDLKRNKLTSIFILHKLLVSETKTCTVSHTYTKLIKNSVAWYKSHKYQAINYLCHPPITAIFSNIRIDGQIWFLRISTARLSVNPDVWVVWIGADMSKAR